MLYYGEPCTETISAKVPRTLADKLDKLARQHRRSKSQIIGILLERASAADLDPQWLSAGKANDRH